MRLDVQFGSSPVSSLGVVANGVPGLHANPLRDRAVLLLLLAQDLLDFKRLLRWLWCFLRRKSFRVSEKSEKTKRRKKREKPAA